MMGLANFLAGEGRGERQNTSALLRFCDALLSAACICLLTICSGWGVFLSVLYIVYGRDGSRGVGGDLRYPGRGRQRQVHDRGGQDAVQEGELSARRGSSEQQHRDCNDNNNSFVMLCAYDNVPSFQMVKLMAGIFEALIQYLEAVVKVSTCVPNEQWSGVLRSIRRITNVSKQIMFFLCM